MPSSTQQKILPYSSNDLFDIVLDIKKYPEFIPWCSASRIISKNNKRITADLLITYKLYNETFRSFVDYNKKDKIILVHYTEGPLKSLNTNWKFTELKDNRTLLNFDINFEFKFSPLQLLARNFYKIIEEKMMKAFENRAKEILKNKG